MKKLFSVLILSVVSLFSCLSATAKPLAVSGEYTGIRTFSKQYQKALEKISKKHFMLLQAGKTSEAAKYYNKEILPLKNKISQSKGINGGTLDIFILSYTYPSAAVTVRGTFPPRSEKERKAGFDNLLVQYRFSAENYLKIFESDKDEKISFEESGDDITVTATGSLKNRKIFIKREYRLDGGPVRKKSFVTFKIENGQIVSVNMFRQKKFTFSLGFKTVFAGLMNLTSSKKGLELRGETYRARIHTTNQVLKAGEKSCTVKDFEKIVGK